jgi:hypothetical protein
MSDTKLTVPAGKTVYWRGRTYTQGMDVPADYPEPEHIRVASQAPALREK